MAVVRFIVLIALSTGFVACKHRSNVEQAKVLMTEGNALIAQHKNILCVMKQVTSVADAVMSIAV